MEQQLWALAFILAPLKIRLDLFHGGMDRDETLESQEGSPLNFPSSVKFTMEPHPPMRVSGNSFPCDTTQTCTTNSITRTSK